jgi:hypothetical protein
VRRRRGFTVLETLLALTLASMVIASMLGVYQILRTSDRLGAERLEEAADFAVAQNVMRRVMSNLVAARPVDPTRLGAGGGDDDAGDEDAAPGDDEAAGADDEEARAAILDDAEAAAEGGDGLALPGMEGAIVPTVAPGTPVMFELMWETFSDGVEAQSVEVVVSRPPVRLQRRESAGFRDRRSVMEERLEAAGMIASSVRGRIEVAEYADGWALQWRQLEPPSEPFILLRQIEWAEWTILPITREVDDWKDVHAAFLVQDFPAAVRLQVWSASGAHEDWLFEPIVTVQE